ncbi:transglutaminase domain-containing protein [Solibacillus sp. FSL K6-1523]|uniref:transglutaminase domain-containing protein n=1 Tax=Solibacillus sp. FSL K6-1523 TaxID=2921471 RepID=UPI0030F82031
MSDFLFFTIIFLVVLLLTLLCLRAFFVQWHIRKAIGKGLKINKQPLQIMSGYSESEHLIYNQVEDYAKAKTGYLRVFRSRYKLDRQIHRELNRKTKNAMTRFFSWLLVTIKFALSFVLVVASLLFGSIVRDEWQAADLCLPTLDPNLTIARDIDPRKSIDELLAVFSDNPKRLQTFNYADSNDLIEPVYPTYQLPEVVNSAETLGQAMSFYMGNFKSEFTVNVDTRQHDMKKIMEEAYTWMDKNEPYLYRTTTEIQSTYYDYGSYAEVHFTMNYDLTAEQHAQMHGKVKQLVEEMPPNLSDVEKVKYVNDYIVSQTVYELDSKASPYTPYSVLMNGEGVCQGYALAVLLLFDEMGMEAQYVTGDAIPVGGHAWNLVKVDGEWYHLDTTWNDPIPDQGKNIRYDYFLLADETLARDHVWAFDEYPKTADVDYY